MIEVGISYGFGEDNRYKTEDIPPNIQLALYKYDLFKNNEKEIITALEKAKTYVLTVHLPLDTVKIDPSKVMDIINTFHDRFQCEHFIVHPNKGFSKLLEYYLTDKYIGHTLCIETFGWRSRKELRSPLDIMECCILNPKTTMCIDTSHIEELWFEYKLMYKLLQYTSVIHLSNKGKGYGQHLPFNSPHGDLNLVSFIRDLKKRYNWSGTIILEYMPEHQDKLIKNYNYLRRLLNE